MSPPSSDSPPGSSTLSLERTHMAATRTLLSLLRTGAAIAGGGAVVTDLLVKGWPKWVAVTLSAAFVLLGSAVMWASLRTGRRLRAQLQRERAEIEFLFPLRAVTLATVVLQLLILVVLALYLIG